MAWGGSNFSYTQVINTTDWPRALELLLNPELGAVMVEIYTETELDAAILKEFYSKH